MSRAHRILFVTDMAAMGGAEAVLMEILRSAMDVGVEPALFVSHPEPGLAEMRARLPKGVALYTVEQSFATRLFARGEGMLRASTQPLDELAKQRLLSMAPIARGLRLAARDFCADSLYIAKLLPQYASLARVIGLPYVLHSHATPPSLRRFSANEVRLAIGNATSVLAASTSAQRFMQTLAQRDSFLLYDGADVVVPPAQKRDEFRKRLGADADDFVWYMSGRFEYEKGCDYVEPLMERLRSTRAHFVWLGGKDDCAFAEYCAERLGKNPRVHLLGRQREDYWNWLSATDGFAFVSREDCFPLVAVEAAAAGKPIVTFPSGGITELVEGTAAPIIADWSIQGMADAMTKLMNEGARSIGDSLIPRGKAFGFERVRAEWARYWREQGSRAAR